MNGVLNIDKPAGITSHDVVYRIRKLSRQKRVGHAGTLDPDATGVLLVCLGHATRLSDLLAEQGKQYRAVLRLGVTTSTEDSSGSVIDSRDPSTITLESLQLTIPHFTGSILQTPPMVSAVHYNGQRLYNLARQGITVEREARTVQIDSIELLSFSPGAECSAVINVQCGKGTYIRTLCADIGAALGVGGHMASLRRTSVGNFGIDTAVTLDNLMSEDLPDKLISSSEAVSFLKPIMLSSSDYADILNGKRITSNIELPDGELVQLVYESELIALARHLAEGYLQPEKVFPPSQ